jgi:CAAX protease family protein
MEQFREMVRRLPVGVEFVIVVSLAFGRFILASILAIGTPELSTYSNQALISVVVTELLNFAFLAWFLHLRGWTLEKFGLRVTVKTTAGGILLAAATVALFYFVQIVGSHGIDMVAAQNLYPKVAPKVDLQLVLLGSVVNGAYEEIFVAGYVITVLAGARGIWIAVNVSTGIRLLYHLYQGTLGVLTIVPMGLLYGYLYVRTKRLWPLVLAHILVDIYAFVVSMT